MSIPKSLDLPFSPEYSYCSNWPQISFDKVEVRKMVDAFGIIEWEPKLSFGKEVLDL